MANAARENDSFYAFFTSDSRFVGLKDEAGNYRLFRSRDGSAVCCLNSYHTDFTFSFGVGGFRVATGMIDAVTRKCMPWGIKALVNFSKDALHLFKQDLPKDSAERCSMTQH